MGAVLRGERDEQRSQCNPGGGRRRKRAPPKVERMRVGLRTKAVVALGATLILVAGLAAWPAMSILRRVEANLGMAFARNATQLSRQRILTPITRELALSQRLTDAGVTRDWLADALNPVKKRLFFTEAERYRRAFADHSWFIAVRQTGEYFFNDASKRDERPRQILRANRPADSWFFSSLKANHDFNINVDANVDTGATKVWFNVLARDGGVPVGVVGSGLDLTAFLRRYMARGERGVTSMMVNAQGAIEAHPDRRLIDYSTVSKANGGGNTLYRLLPRPEDRDALRDALRDAQAHPDALPTFWGDLDGQRQLFAVASIPELHWFALTAVDLSAARLLDRGLWLPLVIGGIVLLALIVIAGSVVVDRLALAPLLRLTRSVRRMGTGDYAVDLPPAADDELGELTRAFGAMAERVRTHTEELDGKVRERTRELVTVNHELVTVNEAMAAAHKQIGDSIEYASMIQNALLPARDMQRSLAESHFVLWRPRDIVSGDFYVYRADDQGCLLGVVDCAGHGVPGALMTMVAHTAITVATEMYGLTDPARLLHELDTRVRCILQTEADRSQVATHMDAGFAYVDFQARKVSFAGAKVSLYWCDGHTIGESRGARYAIGGKRNPTFTTTETLLDPNQTFYLTTDGLLDQAGGPRGFGFGNRRFAEVMKRHSARPLAEQRHAFEEELKAYQGDLPQRDDITMLCFRFT